MLLYNIQQSMWKCITKDTNQFQNCSHCVDTCVECWFTKVVNADELMNPYIRQNESLEMNFQAAEVNKIQQLNMAFSKKNNFSWLQKIRAGGDSFVLINIMNKLFSIMHWVKPFCIHNDPRLSTYPTTIAACIDILQSATSTCVKCHD